MPDFDDIRNAVGHYGYFALALFIIMYFSIAFGLASVPVVMAAEVFPFE